MSVQLVECECHAEAREAEVAEVAARLERINGFSVARVCLDDASSGYVSSYRVYRGAYGTGEAYVSFDGIACSDDTYGCASSYTRSNYRSLKRDFPDFPWVDISYTNMNTLGCFVADLDEEMEELLTGLAENYPIYDEGDHSDLEQEEIEASWSGWMRDDLYREFDRMRMTTGTMQTIWDRLGNDTVEDLFWACVSADVFGLRPEHNGVEVVWGRTDELVNAFRPYLIHAYVSHRAGSVLPAGYTMVDLIECFREGGL